MNMLSEVVEYTDNLLIRLNMELRKMWDEMDGMETLQVMIIIAIALGVAAAVIRWITGIQATADSKVNDFNSVFGS